MRPESVARDLNQAEPSPRGNTMRQLSVIICSLILPLTSACGEEPVHQRWALLATADVARTGITDLLTVELSKDPAIQLVERERLQEVMQELQLTALVKPDHVRQRLTLGKTLRADALMVLSFEGRQDDKQLRIIVCDARLGVRLWRGSFAATDADIELLVEQCVATVGEVRQRFGGGIRHIVAVPPFLSNDFQQRFDYLQSRYSDLLSSRMMAFGGVAAVEIDEARAVLRELEDTLTDGLDRPISTIVKGTYSVTPLDRQNRRNVELKVDLISGAGKREQIEQTLELSRVGQWLADDLAKRLYDASRSGAPALPPKTQKEILTRHAQRFAKLGDWERSRPLREAALVLDHNDVLQRGLVIREYQLSVLRDVSYIWFKNLPPIEENEPVLRRAAHDYQVALGNLEYLIRNQMIKRRDAAGLFFTQRWQRVQGSGHPHAQKYFAAMEPARQAQRQFIREVGPLIIALPQGHVLPLHMTEPFYGYNYILTKHVANDVTFSGYSAESLASLEDLLTRVLPESDTTSAMLLGTFWQGSVYIKNEGWWKLLERLASSKHELAKLYGRWGLLLATDVSTARQSGMESLLKDMQQLGRMDEPLADQLETQITRTKNRLAVARKPPQPDPAKQRPYSADDYYSLGRVQLHPVQVRVEGEKESYRPLLKGMLQCGENCDAYWTNDRFFLMHKPGVLREVKLTEARGDKPHFWNATWDGECIWIFAQHAGICVIQSDGQLIATFRQSEHMPGYWKGFQLVGLSPRRALMVGSFGASNRAWCGILSIDKNGKPSADVFFEAKYVADGRAKAMAEADPNTAFQPDRMLHVRDKNGKRFVFVSRKNLSKYLRIDPATREVSVASTTGLSTRTDLGFRGRTFLVDGHSMATRSRELQNANTRQYVFHDGWLYAMGHFWYRVHIETGKEERLQPRGLKMPTVYWNTQGGPSAHYGMVIHHLYHASPSLYRVTIADKASAQRGTLEP